jgi:uncharacterized protein with PIN domain
MHREDEKQLTFFVDAMLGNIAKKLRLMGYDSSYFADIEDDELIKLAKNDKRIIISRDEELIQKAQKIGLETIFLKNNEEIEQFHEIIRELNLKTIQINGDKARCPKCNSETNPIDKKNIQEKVPNKVLENNEKFWMCDNCDQIFWEGTHIRNLQKLVAELNERG